MNIAAAVAGGELEKHALNMKGDSNYLKNTVLSNQSQKWCKPRYCNPAAVDAWSHITKLLLKSEPWGEMEIHFTFFQYT